MKLDEYYFWHLLDEVRASERRGYRKVTDIYTTAMNRSVNAPTKKLFSKKIIGEFRQNLQNVSWLFRKSGKEKNTNDNAGLVKN